MSDMPPPHRLNAGTLGFTLVELSVVIVIIGFVVSGVMLGVNLADRAQKQTIISDLGKFNQAIVDFNKKYLGIPGDMSNADYFFGTSCGAGVTAQCDGNGDGVIGYVSSGEHLEPWEHLSLASMTPGYWRYNAALTLGTNVPTSNKTGAGYWLYGQVLIAVGMPRTNAGTTYMDGKTFTPDDVRYFDNKMDDGLPGTGNIQARIDQSQPTNNTICINTANNSGSISSATYIMTDKTTSCFMIYVTSLGNTTITYTAH